MITLVSNMYIICTMDHQKDDNQTLTNSTLSTTSLDNPDYLKK